MSQYPNEKSAGFVDIQPSSQSPPNLFINDPLFLSKLDSITNYELRRANVLLQVLTDGLYPNTYVISDRDQVMIVACCFVMRN